MTFYDEMAGVAAELLGEFKQGVIVLSRPGTSTPGENEWDADVSSAPIEHVLDGIAKGVSAEFVDGSTILATDMEIMCAVLPVVPTMATDTVSVDGKPVTLLRIDQIPAAGTPVAFRLFVRA